MLQEESADEVLAALNAADAGRTYLADFQAYSDEFGRRGDKFVINAPTWIEDPRPAIRMLQDYVSQLGGDPEAGQAELAAERERLIAQARQRLEGYPQQVVEQFEFLLRAAQAGTRLQEDHNYWIDQLSMYEVRRVIMELGGRFAAAGALDTPGDIFYLTPDEIRATGRGKVTAGRRDLVAQRKADEARYQSLQPAPALGTIPPGPSPDNPLFRAAGKFWGPPPQPSEESGVLRGGAGSPGRTRGPAKVIRSLRDAGKLQAGDVLVAETTAPPWTPFFATPAAVVTDTGGVLSHCVIVAREYRIPAVVGAGVATSALRDGQIVEVDGDAGLVRIHSDS